MFNVWEGYLDKSQYIWVSWPIRVILFDVHKMNKKWLKIFWASGEAIGDLLSNKTNQIAFFFFFIVLKV